MLRKIAPQRGEHGFSLAELLVAIVIFGILASIAVPVYLNQRNKSLRETLRAELAVAATALEEQRTANNGRYPNPLPRTITFDPRTVVSYTVASRRAGYCLQGTINNYKMQVHSADLTPKETTPSNDCIYGVKLPAPILKGSLDANSNPNLQWNRIEGAVSYAIYANSTKITTASGSATSIQLARQTLGTAVRYSIAAIDSTGAEGERSNSVELRTPLSAPTSAPALSVQSATTGPDGRLVANLQWTSVPLADRYEVYNADTQEKLLSEIGNNASVTVPAGTNGRYFVIAVNNAGVGPRSNVVTVEGPKLPATTLNAQVSNSNVITLNWNAVATATGYLIYRNGTVFTNASVNGTTATIAASSSTPGTVYDFYVVAVDSRGRDGNPSNTERVSIRTGAPTLTAQDASTNSAGVKSVRFDWNAVSGSTGYIIYNANTGAKIGETNASTQTLTISNLVNVGETGSYYMVATSAAGASDNSNNVIINGVNGNLTGLDYTQQGPSEARFVWDSKQYSQGVEVTIRRSNGLTTTVQVAAGVTQWLSGSTLTAGETTTYSFRHLYSNNVKGESVSRGVFLPAAPTNLRATQTSIGHTTSTWNWTFTRAPGTTESQVTVNGTVINSNLSGTSFPVTINHDATMNVVVQGVSPDSKMRGAAVTASQVSPHPSAWHNSSAQYDFFGNGNSGSIARNNAGVGGDQLFYYSSTANGGTAARVAIGSTGWNAMKHIVPTYDWKGQGSAGLFVVNRSSGRAYYYESRGNARLASAYTFEIGQGVNWANYQQIIYFNEWDGPGNNVLLARDSNNDLWKFDTYSDGTVSTTPVKVGGGFEELSNASNWQGDSVDDVMTRSSTGALSAYSKTAGANGVMTNTGRTSVASNAQNYTFQPYESWGGIWSLVSVEISSNTRYLYPRTSTGGINAGGRVVSGGTGWTAFWETGAGRPTSPPSATYN